MRLPLWKFAGGFSAALKRRRISWMPPKRCPICGAGGPSVATIRRRIFRCDVVRRKISKPPTSRRCLRDVAPCRLSLDAGPRRQGAWPVTWLALARSAYKGVPPRVTLSHLIQGSRRATSLWARRRPGDLSPNLASHWRGYWAEPLSRALYKTGPRLVL